MLKLHSLVAINIFIVMISANVNAALDIESSIQDKVEENLSKACVDNWAKTRKATGTLTTIFIDDQGDRFWVKAYARINKRLASGESYPELVSDIDIHCNVTGKEKMVKEYRKTKSKIKKVKDDEKNINENCTNEFRKVFYKNTNWVKGWASTINSVTKTKSGRTLAISTQASNVKNHHAEVKCGNKGEFLSYRTIKVTAPGGIGGMKIISIKHEMTP